MREEIWDVLLLIAAYGDKKCLFNEMTKEQLINTLKKWLGLNLYTLFKENVKVISNSCATLCNKRFSDHI